MILVYIETSYILITFLLLQVISSMFKETTQMEVQCSGWFSEKQLTTNIKMPMDIFALRIHSFTLQHPSQGPDIDGECVPGNLCFL